MNRHLGGLAFQTGHG